MTAPAPSMPPPSALREWASRLRAWNAWRRGTGGAMPESQGEYGALLDVVADALIAIADALKAMERGEAMNFPPILDATCGSRMIHFDKDCPDVLFMDNRRVDGEAIWKSSSKDGTSVRRLNIRPDVVADFTAMPFPDETFWLVVFDPPHLNHGGDNAWMIRKYGRLDKGWPTMLRDGFRECMRVLKPGGTLIFKWSEVQIQVGEVWKAIGARPIFGTRCGKRAGTIWATFWKGAER